MKKAATRKYWTIPIYQVAGHSKMNLHPTHQNKNEEPTIGNIKTRNQCNHKNYRIILRMPNAYWYMYQMLKLGTLKDWVAK